MPDFPDQVTTPQRSAISSFGPTTIVAHNSMAQNVVASTAAAWPAINRALYIAFWVEQPCTARKIAVHVGTQSGNLDLGIYTSEGNRIVSKGSTGVGTGAAVQIVDLTASVTGTASPVLRPGTYFLAMVVGNTTATFKASTLTLAEMCRIAGVQQEALGATTLPATAAFSNPASAYVPVITVETGTLL